MTNPITERHYEHKFKKLAVAENIQTYVADLYAVIQAELDKLKVLKKGDEGYEEIGEKLIVLGKLLDSGEKMLKANDEFMNKL